VPGRELAGIHFAMTFLTQQNRLSAGEDVSSAETISAREKRVVVLGGGDTGSDCVGTSLRQGATSVLSLELFPRPPDARRPDNPWPAWPQTFRSSSSHEEGGQRDFGVLTKRFVGRDDHVQALHVMRVELRDGKLTEIPGTDAEIPADLVLLAMGFVGPVWTGLLEQLGVERDLRGNVCRARRRNIRASRLCGR